jgi:hypothetical protein
VAFADPCVNRSGRFDLHQALRRLLVLGLATTRLSFNKRWYHEGVLALTVICRVRRGCCDTSAVSRQRTGRIPLVCNELSGRRRTNVYVHDTRSVSRVSRRRIRLLRAEPACERFAGDVQAQLPLNALIIGRQRALGAARSRIVKF